MDSLEFTKFAGSLLAALLLIFGTRTAIEIARSGHTETTAGFTLPAPAESAAPGAAEGDKAAAAAAFDPAAVVAMIKTANPENGANTFKKCAGCHNHEKGAANKVGPNLWGILGSKKAAHEDFKGYSDAMKTKGGEWTYEDLASFLHSPKAFVPGTKMTFAGVSDTGELADLVAYLRTLSDAPADLP